MVKLEEKSGEERRLEKKVKELFEITKTELSDSIVTCSSVQHAVAVSNPNSNGLNDIVGMIIILEYNKICVYASNLLESAMKLARIYEQKNFGEFTVKINY